MKIYPDFESLPREDKYAFDKLFGDRIKREIPAWYATEIYGDSLLKKLGESMPWSRYEIKSLEEHSPWNYMVIWHDPRKFNQD